MERLREEGEEEGNQVPEDDASDGQNTATDSDADAERSFVEGSAGGSGDTDVGDGDDAGETGLPVTRPPKGNDRRKENAPENGSRGDRSRERLAWRCVAAARAAASLVPPLAAHALLPGAALRLPHSCAPAVRVPAGDRRSYNARGGGGGAAGLPLTVATVALRDIPAGVPLSCSWVDAQEPFSTRMSRLKEYSRVAVVPPTPAVAVTGLSEFESSSVGRGSEGAGGGAGRCGGCGCPKCFVESHGVGGGRGEGGDRSGLGVERLLKAANQAVDEDR